MTVPADRVGQITRDAALGIAKKLSVTSDEEAALFDRIAAQTAVIRELGTVDIPFEAPDPDYGADLYREATPEPDPKPKDELGDISIAFADGTMTVSSTKNNTSEGK